MKAYELLADPAKWTKGALAKDGHRCRISPRNANAQCFCALGAISRLYPNVIDGKTARLKVEDILPEPYLSITGWNDADERKHAEVVELLRKADV